MKILFVLNNLDGRDGWSRNSLDLIREIKNDTGNEVLCLVNRLSGKRDFNQIEGLCSPTECIFNISQILKSHKLLQKTINDFKPEVIHFMVEPYANMLPFLKLGGAKPFVTICGTYSFMPGLTDNVFKKTLSLLMYYLYSIKAAKIISISNYTKDFVLRKSKLMNAMLKNKIEVITAGIAISPVQKNVTSEIENNEISKKIISVGAVKKRKGLLESIRALTVLRDEYDLGFKYQIVGKFDINSSYFIELQNLIKKHKMEDVIVFEGEVSNDCLDQLYREADLFLMLPINDNRSFEGFGLVFLEANLRGTPCIGSGTGGSREAIIDGVTGYLVDPNNSEEVANKIHDILFNNSIVAKNCIDWAKKNDIHTKAGRIMGLYAFDTDK